MQRKKRIINKKGTLGSYNSVDYFHWVDQYCIVYDSNSLSEKTNKQTTSKLWESNEAIAPDHMIV